MFSGNHLWPSSITQAMCNQQIGCKQVNTYQNMPNNLYDVLSNTMTLYKEKIAIVDNEQKSYTFSQLLSLTDDFSSYLTHGASIKKGDHVGLLMYNTVEFCVAFFALCKIGAVSVPLPSKYKQEEILSLMSKSNIKHMICDESFYPWIKEYDTPNMGITTCVNSGSTYGFSHLNFVNYAPTPSLGTQEDNVIVMFTSGTTSMSKGVMIKNYNMMHAIISYQKLLGITHEDSSIIPIPIYHITGLVALLGLFTYVGGTLHLHKFFDAKKVLACVEKEKLTFIHSSPTVFFLLLQEKFNFPSLPSLKSFACGSSNMATEKLQEIHAWLPHVSFRTIYGLTETTSPATVFPCDAATSPYSGSSGLPIPGTEFKVVDDDGHEVANNSVGEVLVRGSVVLEAYYNMESDLILPDGFLKTGDLGYFNEQGYLYIVDRKKDMINHGGEKIWSFDIENELYKLPQIEEAAVVGIPDETYGEVAAAVIKLLKNSQLTEEEVKRFLKTNLASYKVPKKIVFVPHVLKTPNGKVDKKNIRIFLNNN